MHTPPIIMDDMPVQSGDSPFPPPPSGSTASTPESPRKLGCATVLILIFLIGGIALINMGSSSDFNRTCRTYPEDGYCSLQQMVSGAGWMLVALALLAVVGAVWSEKSKDKNRR